MRLGGYWERFDEWISILAHLLWRWVKQRAWSLHLGSNFNKGSTSLNVHSLISTFCSQRFAYHSVSLTIKNSPFGAGEKAWMAMWIQAPEPCKRPGCGGIHMKCQYQEAGTVKISGAHWPAHLAKSQKGGKKWHPKIVHWTLGTHASMLCVLMHRHTYGCTYSSL